MEFNNFVYNVPKPSATFEELSLTEGFALIDPEEPESEDHLESSQLPIKFLKGKK